MADLDFSTKLGNGGISIFDTPQLKLDAREKARIFILDSKVKMEYTHYIKGDPNDEQKKGGQVLCLGDKELLSKPGATGDPDRCPACAATLRPENGVGNDAVVSLSKRRYVMYVAQYGTAPNNAVPIKPVTLKLLAWVFTDTKYNSLVDLAKEYGGLQNHDIILTCTAKMYQTFEMMPANGDPAWTTSAGSKEQYEAILERRSPEIGRMLGRPMTYDAMELMVSSALPSAYSAPGSLQSQMEDQIRNFDTASEDEETEEAIPMNLEDLLKV